MNGRYIRNKQNLYFTRHAESYGNVGQDRIDSPLTETGVEQAKKLIGHYDLIVCSPLRRAKETLHYSQLTYDKLIICDQFRERLMSNTDRMLLETQTSETDETFWNRVWHFHHQLEDWSLQYKSILLIGHGYFFNGWFRNGCFPNPQHAQVIELL
ncbi:MAG TPA: phosphoglycerate mutase family protein [Candidatus Saccharimonadales bacterium]|nr:phosphoglycerate mutase family protein [Candidatus Saccharimonadales bacterium]